MNISINTAGMNYADMTMYAQWAALLWDLRTDIAVDYAGTTSNTTPSSNETLIRMASSSEWSSYGFNSNVAAATVTSGGSTAKLVLINPNVTIGIVHNEILIHEIGHALGYVSAYPYLTSHSPDIDDIMYYQVGVGGFPVSTADAKGVIAASNLPHNDWYDIDATAMRWDGDLFIPDIIVGGVSKQVQLDYQGVQNLGAGSKDTWRVHSAAVNEEGNGGSTYINGNGQAVLHSVQSLGQDFADYTLSIVTVGGINYAQLESYVLAS